MINPGGPGTLLKLTLAAVAAALIAPAAAGAAVTVGQSPPSAGTSLGSSPLLPGPAIDVVQLSSGSGNSYTVPAGGGVITSWRTMTGAGSVKLRTFKIVPGGLIPQAESATEALSPSPTQYSTRVPVAGGEQLGVTATPPGTVTDPYYTTTGEPTDLAATATSGPLGAVEPILSTSPPGVLLNLSAQLEPDADKDGYGDETQDLCPIDAATQAACTFTIGTKKLNKKKGTAKLSVTVPGAGELTLSGKNLATKTVTATAAGTVKLNVKAKGKAKKKLKSKGKAKVKPTIAYTPASGQGSEQTTKLKLKRS